ncbi:hypothetical protein L2E82_14739 [Cichorium intybus]|uniref:Uncharacterized protein n=1 Tax=Cichorium intybus TaxID=13427 RepID=A0ACB9F204_CICIN|nr:hypothetical protein L2E82_14739 [Cichorium intybus]
MRPRSIGIILQLMRYKNNIEKQHNVAKNYLPSALQTSTLYTPSSSCEAQPRHPAKLKKTRRREIYLLRID